MALFYKCEYFDIEELVDRKTFELWGEKSWMFLKPDALISLDQIRKYFNKPTWVNNWVVGGPFQWRGFRPPYCDVGAIYSQHRFGNAFDLDVEGMEAHEVRQVILNNEDHFLMIMCLEINISWVHFDLRNIPDRIKLVKP
jgi:hypothetical protein